MLLFVDNLTNVDFSFLDPERGLLGETWLAHIQLQGELDEQGMVCDFGTVKKILRHWLDTELDHRLAIPIRAPGITLLDRGELLDIQWQFGNNGEWIHTLSPRQSIALIDAEILTPETVASWCISRLRALFPDSIDQLQLTFQSENISGAFYHYSHGLKKHGGNCQRIAHGHRSRIDIWIDGEKSPQLETEWAKKWRDIYLGSREDVVAKPQIANRDYYRFAYTSAQGSFELTLPQDCCYLVDTDTTVEFLAAHIAQEIHLSHPDKQICVKAFEGLNKGAMANLKPARS